MLFWGLYPLLCDLWGIFPSSAAGNWNYFQPSMSPKGGLALWSLITCMFTSILWLKFEGITPQTFVAPFSLVTVPPKFQLPGHSISAKSGKLRALLGLFFHTLGFGSCLQVENGVIMGLTWLISLFSEITPSCTACYPVSWSNFLYILPVFLLFMVKEQFPVFTPSWARVGAILTLFGVSHFTDPFKTPRSSSHPSSINLAYGDLALTFWILFYLPVSGGILISKTYVWTKWRNMWHSTLERVML